MPRRWRLLGLVGGLVVLTALLPKLLGRPALYASPGGRVALARQWWAQARPVERWLGHGLASQSDPRRAEALRAPGLAQEGKASRERGRGPSGDGQPLLLLAQGGVVAAGAFYGLVGWCAWRDPLLRPFWGVLTLLSLTLNVTEVFPMGIWLAVDKTSFIQVTKFSSLNEGVQVKMVIILKYGGVMPRFEYRGCLHFFSPIGATSVAFITYKARKPMQ